MMAPAVGLLWTPGYWGWNNGLYAFNTGYWGPQVGFYGGVNYGYGYGGTGYGGGRWNGGNFNYNTAVMRVNTTVIRNTYVDRTVINNVNVNRVSYNGGQGGINVRPNQAQIAAEQPEALRTREYTGAAGTSGQSGQGELCAGESWNSSARGCGEARGLGCGLQSRSSGAGAKPVKANETRPVATAKSGSCHATSGHDHAPGE